ncbi:type II secretion system F family protein [Kluyvera sichuanensis]|uniref:type II secretion system F family protein n=1 Tax=Kluyvera sichuanensis TaxID=2725494 RepID=UPI0034A4318F
MMIVFVSIVFLLIGIFQIYLSVKNTKKIQSKILSTNIIARHEHTQKKLIITNLVNYVKAVIEKIRRNLIGKNSELLIRNIAITAVGVAAALYVNTEFLQFDHFTIAVIVMIIIPYILYIQQIKKSRSEFERDFSEALNIINSAVRVGRPVLQGFEECAKMINSDFGQEFKRILMRLDIGDEPERVFMDSYYRYPYSEYFSFVITVLINLKGGGQVSEVMTRLTMLISASKALDRKKIAMTAEARMSVKVLVIIPVFFFFFIKFVSPDNFDILIGTDSGRAILYYAIGSILTGIWLVWMMMNKVG